MLFSELIGDLFIFDILKMNMVTNNECIIIGGGYGGLLCGAILAKNGYRITIIDQNKQLGGCLQSFGFDKQLFDSCVHYIGGIHKGSSQLAIFDYLGITAQLYLKPLSNNSFDTIIIDQESYALPQGYVAFKAQLQNYFPEEAASIATYIADIQACCAAVPLYNLKNEDGTQKDKWASLLLYDYLNNLGMSPLLQQVITGNSLLYAGNRHTTSFMMHALIMNAYILGSATFERGSAQLTKALTKIILNNGGTIINKTCIVRIQCANNSVVYIQDAENNTYKASHYIANIHPAVLMPMLDGDSLRNIYKQRIINSTNSISAILVNLTLKPNTVPYTGTNYYHPEGTLDITTSCNQWALYLKEDAIHKGYASSAAILAYDDMSNYKLWEYFKNTKASPQERDDAYKAFKQNKAQMYIDAVSKYHAELANNITNIQVATPLTFRDYMGTIDGSMYGIVKDANAPMQNQIPTPTKLENLYLTGQNNNLHGILGVSLTALQTCGNLINYDELLAEIRRFM